MLKRLIIIWRNCPGSRTDQSTRVAARHEHAGWFFKEADLFENFLEDSSSYDFPEEFNPPDGKEVARVNTGVYQPFSLFLYPRFAPFSFHPIQIERGEEELLEPISFNVSLFPQGESIFSFPFFFFLEKIVLIISFVVLIRERYENWILFLFEMKNWEFLRI